MLETAPRVGFLRRLSEGGFDDVLVLSRATAEEVLTEKRMELLRELAADDADITSMRDLGRRLDRDISIVSRDCDVLYEADVIDYEESGRSKRPVLAHENVVVEPIVFDGDVPFERDENTDSETEHVAAE
jgi:predicted transcriptional regulator